MKSGDTFCLYKRKTSVFIFNNNDEKKIEIGYNIMFPFHVLCSLQFFLTISEKRVDNLTPELHAVLRSAVSLQSWLTPCDVTSAAL